MPVTPGVRYWLVDTGCPVDLAGRQTLPASVKERISEAEEPQNFDTANGSLPANEEVTMQVEGIPETITPYVLEDSPVVLTVGQ